MSGKIGGKSNDQNKRRLFDLLESYMMYVREEGYTDFGTWCQDNIEGKEQMDLLIAMYDKVSAVMSMLCFDTRKGSGKRSWVTFSLNGKEIAAFTIKGMAPGEIQATVELLAYEKGVTPAEITVGAR